MLSLKNVSDWCQARIANGDPAGVAARLARGGIRRLATLGEAGPEDLAFFFSKNYEAELRTTRAGVILTGTAFVGPLEKSGLPQWSTSLFLSCDDPYSSMAILSREFSKRLSRHDHQESTPETYIHPQAVVHPSARLGAGVRIGAGVVVEEGAVLGQGVVIYPGAFVGPGVEIGDHTVLFPKVTIYENTRIGKRCRIHAGAVIGADGFGYAPKVDPTTRLTVDHQKIYHLGRVRIGDDVEVGANSTIDRGTLGDTVIHSKVKIDNQVQVGHNVELEEGAILCGCSGIAGSSTVGKFAVIGAQAGLGNQVRLGEYSVLAAYTAVTKDFPPHSILAGRPARPQAELYRIQAMQQKLLKERGKKK